MKVIPVIDVLNGIVVHAVKGKRQEYKPIQSVLTQSVDPLAIAWIFKNSGFTDLYIADLDAIIDCSTDFHVIKRIVDETGLKLIVDAGVTDLERAQKLLDSGISKLVIGTETLTTKTFVVDAIERFGRDRIIVSLDLKGNEIFVKLAFDGCLSPLCLLDDFKTMSLSSVIVLDLTRVGSGEGVNVDFLRKVLAIGGMDVYVGGGVRDITDLLELESLGVSGVLVASTLHSGKITLEALSKAKLL